MNIIPELNLNKHPHAIKDNSIVYAENIMLSDDGSILQNEPICELNQTILDSLPEKYEGGVNVVYALPCNTEILFFIRPNNTDSILDILRYDEKNDKSKIVLDNFEYNGGTLLGTFTYNKNNLIIAISEYFEDGSKNIPLKVLNLKNIDAGLEHLKDYTTHSIIPQVTIPTIELSYTQGYAFKGWYYVFIRYKIDDNNYTQWYDTNQSIFIDEYSVNTILRYYVDKDLKIEEEQLSENLDVKNTLTMSKKSDIVNVSFNVKIIKNYDIKYSIYQLGFICITKNNTKSYRTYDLYKDVSVIKFSNDLIEDYSSEELIKTYYNYFNVATLETVNNRLYIGNYNDNNKQDSIDLLKDINLSKDDVTLPIEITPIQNDILDLTTSVTEYETAEVEWSVRHDILWPNKSKFKGTLIERTINSKKVWTIDATQFSIRDNITYFQTNCLPDTIIKYWINPTTDSRSNVKEVFAKNLIFAYDGDITGNYYILDRSGRWTLISKTIYIVSIGDTIYQTETNGKRVRVDMVGIISDLPNYTITTKKHETTSSSSFNILKTNGVLPNSYYNFFIHFIDEYGIATDGIPIYNAINDKENIINNLYKTPNIGIDKYLTLKFKYNSTNLFGYKGYFISYERFDPTIILKGICFVNKANKTLTFFNDELNYKDTIYLNFDHICIFSTQESNDDLNVKLNKGNAITIDNKSSFKIINKTLNVADTNDNILKPTNISITVEENINSLDENVPYIAYVYIEDSSLLYKTENKILTPCSDVMYEVNTEFIVNTKNSFNSNIFSMIYENKTVFDNAKLIYRYIENSYSPGKIINKSPFKIYSFTDFIEVPTESINFNNELFKVFYPANIKNETPSNFYSGSILDVKNTINLFKQIQTSIYNHYPKILMNRNLLIHFENVFNKTIRRSNVIQDESNAINWRKFEIEQYRNINENKGNIIKLISIGKYFIAHTEHSMFLFNGTDTIKSNEGNISLASVDIMNLNYQEVVTSKLGYAGIQKEHHGIVGSFGYIFYDKDNQLFYRYDENKLDVIDSNITNYIKSLNPVDVKFGDDKEHKRLFISIINGSKSKIFSYNYISNTFISEHNSNTFATNIDMPYEFWNIEKINFFSTKIKLYINNVITRHYRKLNPETERYETFTVDTGNISTFGTNAYSKASITIIHNNRYELMKYLDDIIYKINKINNLRDRGFLPVDGKDTYYAADSIQVMSEYCDTGIIDIDTSKNLNSPDNYMTPYWRFGNWHFNAIRNNITKNSLTADEKSRIFGNWFVVKFNFNTDKKIEIESLEFKTSIAEL